MTLGGNSPHKGNKPLPLQPGTSAIPTEDFFEPGARRMSPAEVRVNNERAVLTAIATSDGASAADLARRTGLVPQSIARILLDLENAGLLVRGEARKGFRGQPATPIHINPQGAFSIGCELGWRHYHIMLRDLAGNVLGEHRRQYDYPHAATIFDEIGSVTRLLMNLIPADKTDRVIGMGLAAPSTIFRNLDLLGAPEEQRLAWENVDIAEAAASATGLPVTLFNDGNAACWGELVAMPSPRPTDMVYLTIGTFVGSGLIADGHLWEGAGGHGADLGATFVTDGHDAPRHVHIVASIYALEKQLLGAGLAVPADRPSQWDWDSLDPVASNWIDGAAKWLALALINTRAITEFELAVIDGVLPQAVLDRLVASIGTHLDTMPMLTLDHPRVAKGRLGDSAAAMGAALMPIYRRFFSRKAADTGL
mgnify:CR=1 FL=1